MKLLVKPSNLSGSVKVPPSKSFLQRYIICAALAQGITTICNAGYSGDIAAAVSCAEALGARVKKTGDAIVIDSPGALASDSNGERIFRCRESGTVLRLIIPLAAALFDESVFLFEGSMLKRPLEPYFRLFEENKIEYEISPGRLKIKGRLKNEVLEVKERISSQFVSGLILALPFLEEKTKLIYPKDMPSGGYIDITKSAAAASGVFFEDIDGIVTKPRGIYRPFNVYCEGDWSQAAFWMAARSLGSNIIVMGLNEESIQPDRCIADFLDILNSADFAELDFSSCPDIAPVMAAVAAGSGKTLKLTGCGRLRYKESNRLEVTVEMLKSFGAKAYAAEDTITVKGPGQLTGGCTINAQNDHRIAMAATVLAGSCQSRVIIDGVECVNKSYPEFFDEYKMHGGQIFEL